MFPTLLPFTVRYPKYVALIGFSLFVMGVTLYGFSQLPEQVVEVSIIEDVESVEEIQQSFPEPIKTEFGTSIPHNFIADIPLEEGVVFEQSYSLEYPEQEQLSVVFFSSKAVSDNYVVYKDFLSEQNWMVLNTHEGEEVSSLYAVKEDTIINVTIGSSIDAQSEVSISVLKK